jgi:hypothetical protein
LVRTCPCCGRQDDEDFRFCPECGTALRIKIVEHFVGAKELGDGWLRTSVYLTRPQHVRFSIWKDEGAQAVTSLYPAEAQRLADFLNGLARHAKTELFGTSLRRSGSALRTTVRTLIR